MCIGQGEPSKPEMPWSVRESWALLKSLLILLEVTSKGWLCQFRNQGRHLHNAASQCLTWVRILIKVTPASAREWKRRDWTRRPALWKAMVEGSLLQSVFPEGCWVCPRFLSWSQDSGFNSCGWKGEEGRKQCVWNPSLRNKTLWFLCCSYHVRFPLLKCVITSNPVTGPMQICYRHLGQGVAVTCIWTACKDVHTSKEF